ncbi:M48 family metallopeptidase [Opitutaceae bacterium]|nr:M48 family metallopeptidase [Opitutaceae bacterium]
MDFFEAQALAKKRTTRLVVLFVLAVLGTIIASYGAALLIQALLDHQGISTNTGQTPLERLWQPQLFFGITLVTLLVVGIASFTKWMSFRGGGSVVAMTLGGRRVDSHTTDLKERQLLNIVEEMAIASGSPVPATFVLVDDDSINAFAAGLTPHDAAVAVTRGTLEAFNRDELQAVIGHEFSHILNGDMRLNLRLASVLFGILVIGIAGQSMFRGLRFLRFSGRRSSSSKKGGGGGIIILYLAVALAVTIIGYVGYFFGRLIQSAVSRQREFLADAAAVQFTRNPEGITGALKKIGGQTASPELSSRHAAEINHSFFTQTFRAKFGGSFATHPPLQERIRAIDPQFDGKFIRPTIKEPLPPEIPETPANVPEPFKDIFTPSANQILDPTALLATIGVLSADGIDHAQQLLAGLGEELREATRSAAGAEPLIYALLLDRNQAARDQQLGLLTPKLADATRSLFNKIREHSVDMKLPLAQLALTGLRELDSSGQEHLRFTMRQLAESDARVTSFEYALQRVIGHGLDVGNSPAKNSSAWIYSFGAVGQATGVFLSALAHAGTTTRDEAVAAFEASRPQIPLMKSVVLQFVESEQIDLDALDKSLDRLALAAPPIKERIVAAACAVIVQDGATRSEEIELLRAACAALDVPMPPIARSAREVPGIK